MARIAGGVSGLLCLLLLSTISLHAQAPSITSISPVAGPTATSVTIAGTNFGSPQGSSTVTFNGTAGTPTNWTNTSIVVPVPSGATSGNIVVTVGGNASNGRLFVVGNGPIKYLYDDLGRLTGVVDSTGNAAIYSYDAVGNIVSIARPTSAQVAIASFSPISGPVGTVVTISGTGFNTTPSQNTVEFNNTAATVSSATATQLVVTVPSGATTGTIEVTNSLGTATSSASFTVTSSTGAPTITNFSPSVGVTGAAVTITGTNFSTVTANDKTKFNLSAALVSSATSTSISTTVPAATSSGRISVTTPLGTATSTDDFFIPFSTHVASDVTHTGRMAFGNNQTVSISTASKIGIVVFDATAGQKASVQMSSGTFGNCTLYLFDPHAIQIASNTCAGATNFLDGQVLTLTGTYALGVKPLSSTGSVNLALNNATDTTGTITIGGSPVTVTTTVPGQNNILKFSGNANQKISVSLTSGTYSSGTCNLSVKYSQGTGITTGFCGGTTNFVDTATLPITGNYVLVIDPTGTNTGSVTVKINDASDVTGSITAGGSAVGVTTTAPGQDARLTFSGTANQRVSVLVSSVTNPSATVQLVRPNGTVQASTAINSTPGATFFIDTQTLATTGTYVLLVKHSGTNVGNATLQLYDVPADATGTLTVGSGTLALSTTVPGQNAVPTFSGTSTQKVSISLSSGSYSACNLTLKKPDGGTLTTGSCNGTTQFIDTATLPATGTYTVLLDPHLAATGGVTVGVNDASDVTDTITPGGSSVTATTTVPGQDARLTFSGTATQRVSLRVTSVSNPSASVQLLRPNGTFQTSIGINNTPGATFFMDVQTLATTGTYTLLVAHNGTNVGSATLQLYDVPADPTNTLTIGGGTVGVTTTVPGQNATVTFSGTATQAVTVRLTNNSMSSVTVTLLKPDGSFLNSSSSSASSFNLSSSTLPTTGTYTVKIDPSTTNIGSISVEVTNP